MTLNVENQLPIEVNTKKKKQVGRIFVLGFLSALAPFSMDMYLPALPTLASDLNTSASAVQLSLMFCLLGLALGQLISGPLSDGYGRRKPLIIGMTVFIVASILCAFTSSIVVLCLLRLIQGLAGATGIVISRAIVRDYYTGYEMTKFFALLMLVNSIAPIIAPTVGGQVLRFTSWQGIFVILSIIGAGILLGVIFKLTESLPFEKRQTGGIKQTVSSMGMMLKDRVFMGYCLASGFVFTGMFAYISGSPFVLQDIYGISPQAFGLVFAINSIGIVTASQISSRLSRTVGEKKLLIFGLSQAFLAGLALFIMIQLDLGLIGILIPLFFVVSSVGLVAPASTSLAMQRQGKNAGSASAFIGLAQMGLGAIATPLVGLGGSLTAIPMGLVIAISTFCALLIYFVLVIAPDKGLFLDKKTN
ncbi:Bcr/CflA family multidrug efflux MFS transporter [Ureibacillus chungkukjangi]|uniref:Bcr/CflA family efflux transporter n=1 Tax=Ureibacillus chungkukjangi TaxID=1202712 RepID=A0A318TP77_9BACL|nr:Bcr/CflA family multidrug efflux MFS transporter [Ureibacillus chungkukjangi]PYF06444.1 DHA1 family bicyclomycin/chloramphenicol resistance-like MFS transporter [Ureibacillus chungkukjangi]